ncbi:MAG TPA: hypothetical protein VD816_16090 [Ohtaekwangia sp.]|nr:hypothetical protein [Ohtaekwangia sp.]
MLLNFSDAAIVLELIPVFVLPPGIALPEFRSWQFVETRSKRAKSTLFIFFFAKKGWPGDNGMSGVKMFFNPAKEGWPTLPAESNVGTVTG